MKSKVTYSRFVNALTVILFGALLVGCAVTVREKAAFFILLAIVGVLLVSALLYGPVYIQADSNYIVLGSVLRRKKLAMRDVAHVELFSPTMGAIRVCGAGGFMGYWGIFREGDIGRYYAFYGRASDCFLIRMNNGDKYVVGCNDPDKMVDYIKSHLRA